MTASSRFPWYCVFVVSVAVFYGGAACVRSAVPAERAPGPGVAMTASASSEPREITGLREQVVALETMADEHEADGEYALAMEFRANARQLEEYIAQLEDYYAQEGNLGAQPTGQNEETVEEEPVASAWGSPEPEAQPTGSPTGSPAAEVPAEPTERERIFLTFEGGEELEAESLKFQAPVLKSARFEFAGTQEMEVLYASCDEAIGTNAAARRDCQLRAANRISVTQVLQLSAAKVDKDTFDVALEVWSPETNGLLWGETLEIDAKSARLAARDAYPELAGRYLCWRGVEAACAPAAAN